ncbi:hypothetical protein CsatA_027074 [Cannabis sativa]
MNNNEEGSDNPSQSSDLGSDRALSLWAPILLGMMGNPRRRRRFIAMDFDNEEEEEDEIPSAHTLALEGDSKSQIPFIQSHRTPKTNPDAELLDLVLLFHKSLQV